MNDFMYNRNQHSFPTRRSSDLGKAVRGGIRREIASAHRAASRALRRDRLAARFSDPGLVDGRADADRKSTRLNSSHMSISYAVFCLKKKTLTDWHSTIMNILSA